MRFSFCTKACRPLQVISTSALALSLLTMSCQTSTTEKKEEIAPVTGEGLYETVKKFVALGEHRTASTSDSLTAEWLKSALDSIGANTQFVDFPLTQYFFESGQLKVGEQSAEVFPAWPVKEAAALSQESLVVDERQLSKPEDAKGKLVLSRLKHVHGASTPEIAAQLEPFFKAGAKGILAITENNTGEIVALNTFKDQEPWPAPVYLVAPKDTALILSAVEQKTKIQIAVQGTLKEAKGRNVLAKIGKGKQFVVVSTPTSGWFTTGGERGPGIAIWLGLAKWAAANTSKFPDYTFVFTGNAGHELNIKGAYAFVEKAAPKPEETKLWIHLGAGVAVKRWTEENGQWVLSDSVDDKRGIYYAESVAPAFEKTFSHIKAKKVKGTKENETTVKPGGEGILFKEKGYTNLVSLAYSHRYHHVRSDDEKATSPKLLLELEQALEDFITEQLSTK